MPQDLAARLLRRPPTLDVIIAIGVLGLIMASGANGATRLSIAGVLTWNLAFAVPLIWRRTEPDVAALALIPAHLAQLALQYGPHPGNVSVPIALFAVAAYGRESWSKRWLGFGLLASLVAGGWWSLVAWRADSSGSVFTFLFSTSACAGAVTASWYMGSLKRSREAQSQALHDRADALDREHVKAVQLAATQDRQILAREMHDIVAHSLSIIVVQADGARYVVAEAPGTPEDRLARAAQAIATIQDTARTALAETRRLVGVLHSDADPADLAPAASLADLRGLIRPLTDAGRIATLSDFGDPASHRPLGQVGELAVFRVIQESLTNVLKHAGPEASVQVTLVHTPHGLIVTVRDDGRGPGQTDGEGHGLAGMRERVAALGGSLTTRSPDGRGFEIVASIPTPEEALP